MLNGILSGLGLICAVAWFIWSVTAYKKLQDYETKLDNIKHLLRQGRYGDAIKECCYGD